MPRFFLKEISSRKIVAVGGRGKRVGRTAEVNIAIAAEIVNLSKYKKNM